MRRLHILFLILAFVIAIRWPVTDKEMAEGLTVVILLVCGIIGLWILFHFLRGGADDGSGLDTDDSVDSFSDRDCAGNCDGDFCRQSRSEDE